MSRTCRSCLADERNYGVVIDALGLCAECRQPPAPAPPGPGALQEALTALPGARGHDCIVLWSGGKDSTHVLSVVCQDLGLRPVAVTFDNSFLAPAAFANMATVREQVPVRHLIYRPPTAQFRAALRVTFERLESLPQDSLLWQGLRRHGPACFLCGAVFHAVAIRQALDHGCRTIVTGFTPGQATGYYDDYRGTLRADGATPPPRDTSPRPHSAAPWAAVGRLTARFLAEAGVDPRGLFLTAREAAAARSVSFIRAYDYLPYDPAVAVARSQALGWRRPTETDPTSSNCLLNALHVAWYRDRFGCHPYALELSALVRRGVLRRDAGQALLTQPDDEELLRETADQLGLGPDLLRPRE